MSKRLRMLAGMVTPGSRVADVGCDHGFLSIWLVQAGVSPRAIAMDVRRGPLSAAEEHIAAYGLGDYIETRVSDGLEAIAVGEADTIVCAGMGGRLMERILREGMDKAAGAGELILQPQSEIGEFRSFLRGQGFSLEREEAVCEDGKYYFAMRAVPGQRGESAGGKTAAGAEVGECPQEQRVYDRFGEDLIARGNPVLWRYLLEKKEKLGKIMASLGDDSSLRQQKRLGELKRELADVEWALDRMKTAGRE